MSALVSKLALATVAAVGLYVATVGVSVTPGSCLRTVGVAAADPSPTCGGDERECLRRSAKTGLYGVRYVTPEDVARCGEAFNACIHGTAGGGGSPVPPASTSPRNGSGTTLPQRFGINLPNGAVYDCRLNGDAVNCTISWNPMPEGMISRTGEVTGTLSGLTMSGTATDHTKGDPGDSGCSADVDFSGPATFVFSPDGTVVMREGPQQAQVTFRGSCSSNPSASRTDPATEWTAKWSAIE